MRTAIPLAFLLILVPLAGIGTATAESTPEPTSLGQAIVGFEPGYLPQVAPSERVAGLSVLKVEPRIDTLVVAADDLRDVRSALAGWPGVAYIEDDQILTTQATPNDSQYNQQYGPAQMGAHAAWGTVGWGSSSIKVAVLDSGIRSTHEDLAANYIGGHDYVNNDNTPNDDCGHGTHVSGTVAAVTNNAKGVAGMSQASIIHHKVLASSLFVQCSGSQSNINSAIMDAADDGARVISMSLGGGGYASSGDAAVNYAYGKNALVVAASGNDSSSNGVSYPAAYTNAIAVGALTSSKVRASYSNGGPQLEIVAPGSDVYSTYYSNDASYSSMSGTSMATPHVAGALALALSCDSSLTNAQLRTLMQNNAEDLGASGKDNLYGYGLLRIDWIVNAIGTCGGGGGNTAPVASMSSSTSGLTVSVSGSGSSDADGDSLSYSWNFGDGNSGSGVTDSHTYSSAGTYTVTLTVSDGNGGSDTDSASVTVSGGGGGGSSCGADPDPSVTTLNDGQTDSVTAPSGGWVHRKICVPGDATSLSVVMDGADCGLFGCSTDADLYVRSGAKPTSSAYDCRPYASGSDETCTQSISAAGWWFFSAYGYSGSTAVTLTADHNGAGTPPTNNAPTASFTHSESGLTTSVNGGASSDPDGDTLSYSWTFGDGNSGSGVTASHSYSSAGTYTVTLTVSDGSLSDSTSASVTVTAPPTGCSGGDASVPTMTSGSSESITTSAGGWVYRKICAQSGDSVQVDMTGPSCGLLGCSADADLYVRSGAKPTSSAYDCRPYQGGSNESCSLTAASTGWYYIGVYGYSGSETVSLTASAT